MAPPSDNAQYIHVPYGKAFLRLTSMEFARAIKRGKQYQRAMQQAAREAQNGARQEAARLEWITEE
jgi:Flp pilus assembly protein TadG